MDKKQRKAALSQWKYAERADLVAGMPLSPEQLHQLLDYVDANLKTCDHTIKLTTTFLHLEQLDLEKVQSWLREHTVFCDCEVLANLAELDEALNAPAPVFKARAKQNRNPRSLDTVTGWNFSKLPAPWRVSNLYAPDEPLKLELGKKGGCTLEIIESSLPSGGETSDEDWARLWYDRTELPAKGALQVTHGALTLPDGYESVLVLTPAWQPVFCWVVPTTKSWYVEIRTEFNRYAGDVPQIS